jgi:hypothetical protein
MDYQFNVTQSKAKGGSMPSFIVLSTPEFYEDGTPILPRLKVKLDCILMSVQGGNNIDTQHINAKNKGKKVQKLANAAAISDFHDGTIKTFVNHKDFGVTLKGSVISPNYSPDYPHEAVKDLTEILKHGGALEVESDYLLLFGIYNLFVTGYDFATMEAKENTQAYEIRCLSDAPVEILVEI